MKSTRLKDVTDYRDHIENELRNVMNAEVEEPDEKMKTRESRFFVFQR